VAYVGAGLQSASEVLSTEASSPHLENSRIASAPSGRNLADVLERRGLHILSSAHNYGLTDGTEKADIEFEGGDLTARTADLLKELIGFGLVRVTPTQ
jgi:hypothetical protein